MIVRSGKTIVSATRRGKTRTRPDSSPYLERVDLFAHLHGAISAVIHCPTGPAHHDRAVSNTPISRNCRMPTQIDDETFPPPKERSWKRSLLRDDGADQERHQGDNGVAMSPCGRSDGRSQQAKRRRDAPSFICAPRTADPGCTWPYRVGPDGDRQFNPGRKQPLKKRHSGPTRLPGCAVASAVRGPVRHNARRP